VTKRIDLSRGLIAIVDGRDYETLVQFPWHAVPSHQTHYAQRWDGRRHLGMHVAILRPPEGIEVDHIDGDGLNNQRSNLRLATRKLNAANQRMPRNNTSGYKGVSWLKTKWSAHIRIDGRLIHLGMFEDAAEAGRAYDAAAIEAWGEFAKVNFP
jgi:HNH endonuclease